ncbi:hypothetical protein ACFUJ0_21235 [Streptomyces sp. NPDC057242]|uniref:hypothetical protein n=1 Tax=unclassified Streptomyces TaxID=2593676 RepID=UPI00362BF180
MLDSAPPAPLRPARAELLVRWGGAAIGAAAAWTVAHGAGLGLGVLHALPVFAVCATAGVLAADALTPGPGGGAVRLAGLVPRRVRDVLPTGFALLLAAEAAVLLALLAVAALTAAPDDTGGAGRTLSVACTSLTESRGPWPGLFYGLPVLAALAAGTAACGYALRRITGRPVPGGDSAVAADDARRRRERARAVTAAWGLLVSAPLAGAALFASGALRSLSCVGPLVHTAGLLLLPVAAVAAGTALWSLFTVLAPPASPRSGP